MPRKDSGYYDAAKISEYNHKYYELHKKLKGRQKINSLRGRLRDTANFVNNPNNRSYGAYVDSLNKRGKSYEKSLTRHITGQMNRDIAGYHDRFMKNASLIASRYRNLSPEQKKAHSGEIATQMKLMKESYARGKQQIKDQYASKLQSERKRVDTSDKYKKRETKAATTEESKREKKHDYELGELVKQAVSKEPKEKKESKKKAASSGRGSSGGSRGSGGGRGGSSGGSGGSSGRSSAGRSKGSQSRANSGAYGGAKEINAPKNTPKNRDAVDTSKNKKFDSKKKSKDKSNPKLKGIYAKRDSTIANLRSKFAAGKITKQELNNRIRQAKDEARAQADRILAASRSSAKTKGKKAGSFINKVSSSVSLAKKKARKKAGYSMRQGVVRSNKKL